MAKELTYRINVAQFERETRRLGPAVVGAYIRILLDYFSTGEPPPDEDAMLARIAGVDSDMWRAIRPRLEPLFTIIAYGPEGTVVWFHQHTEDEVAAQNKRSERAKAASAQAKPDTSDIPETRPEFFEGATLQFPKEKPPQELVALGPDVDDMDDDDLGIPEPPVPQPVGIVFEGPLSMDFKPTGAQIVEYQADGYTSEQIAEVLDGFKRYNRAAGTTSNNWPELWVRWWNRKKPPLHPAEKKPKPRVEVTRR